MKSSLPLPQLTLLDTNVIQNLQTFGEFIYDLYLSPEAEERMLKLSRRLRADVRALQTWMSIVQRSGWPLVVSDWSRQELAAAPQGIKREQLEFWADELGMYSAESGWLEVMDVDHDENRAAVVRTLLRRGEFEFLPDVGDRMLIASALTLGCRILLTMDYRTIWQFRAQIQKFGLAAMRPIELVRVLGFRA